MKIIDCKQHTQEWHALRRCSVTGTKLQDVMGTPLAYVQLASELIAEEGTEQTKPVRVSPEMERGTNEEPFAIKEYEARTKRKVTQVGICVSSKYPWLKYSPDGLIKTKGKFLCGIEIKNPDSSTLVFNKLLNEVGMQELGLGSWSKPTKKNPEPVFNPSAKEPFLGIPADYKWQVVCAFLVVDEMEELDFINYDARYIDPDARMYIVTVKRSDPLMQEALKEAEEKLVQFRKDWMSWKEKALPVNF